MLWPETILMMYLRMLMHDCSLKHFDMAHV